MNLTSKGHLLKPFAIFLFLWGILNFFQAFLTPLNNDEAYYWMYSKYLDWGFYDHPPMVALMIRIGWLIFHSELGVRLLVVIGTIAALIVIVSLINEDQIRRRSNILSLIMLVAILPVFNIFGFMATPDGPLLFFSALFFLALKRFLSDDNWFNTLFFGFSMAALVYTKYHGGLLIILVLVSNLSFLKRPKFYFAAILALILFMPHLYWQYSHGFPSFEYHLVERVSGFKPDNVLEYLLNQLVFHNPLILPLCIWLIIKTKAKDAFEKTLNFVVAGFFIFFFIASFRYHIEPQWTVLIGIPMVIIMINNLDHRKWITSYIKWITVVLFPIILFVRFAFMFDFLPVQFLKKEYHNNKKWANQISSLAGERPVIFTNSYQDPSEYTFYTGKFAHSLNNLAYRKTQYDLWDFEEKVHGKEVLYIPHYLTYSYKQNLGKHILPDGDSLFFRVFRDFQSLQRECVILSENQYTFSKNGTDTISFRIFNPYPFPINLKHPELPVVFQLAVFKNGYMEVKKNLGLPDQISTLNIGDTISVTCTFSLGDLPAGSYKLAICSETGILYDIYNSKFRDVKITD